MKRLPIILATVTCVVASSLQAQVPRRPFLFKDGRSEVAAARARGDRAVTLVIAAMPSANARLARVIEGLGGTIRYRNDAVDYLRARVPVDSVARLEHHADLHSLDVTKPQRSRQTGGSTRTTRRAARDTTRRIWPPELSDYPLENRYSPLADIGAAGFREMHPTYDGRGVTIALIDLNPDPLLPELQMARTLDGDLVPKIVAYQTAIDLDEQNDGRWLVMTETVTAASGRFVHNDVSYTAPRDGSFRIAILDEAVLDSLSRAGLDDDLNRDGNPEGSSRLFAVIWHEATDDVWVDTDQDLSFADEQALTDFRIRPEFGVFGEDRPQTRVRESVAFAVQIDRAKQRIAINAGIDRHGSLVVGAAVANTLTGGRFDGVAPGARLANFSEGYASYGQTEAVIEAMQHPLVDVVFLEQGSGITRPYLLRDGRLVPTVIYTRLIAQTGKSLVVPTHNYPILGGIDDFVLARGALGIGGHESADNFFANHGVRVQHHDNLLITGGYGPMGNGALKPDVISPSNYVSTNRGFLEGRRFAGLFQLPPGYTLAGGTSTATPTAAGAVALLISAARQAGIAHDAFRIKHAVTRSARYVPHLPAYKQGNGVVDVAGAWEILQAIDGDWEAVTIASEAPVRHVLSHLLPTPHRGVGLYERDGWTAGDHGERVITLTRTTGPAGSMRFGISWVGNDSATYSAPDAIELPLNTPVPLTIGVAPTTSGVHTAMLTLDYPNGAGYAHRTLATVVAAEPLTAANEFTTEREIEVPRPGMTSFFYSVPPGASVLRVDVSAPKRGVALAVIGPDTRQRAGARSPTTAVTTVVNDPMPGMWEIRLSDIADTQTWDWEEANTGEPVPPTAATLTVSALATGLTAHRTGDGQESGGGFELTIDNRLAAFTGQATTAAAGSARRTRQTIREFEQQSFEVTVPAGSGTLVIRTHNTSDPAADLDLYVYDCTNDDTCWSNGADADFVGDESLVIDAPGAGTWRIVVDAASVPMGSTTYDYLDVVFNPIYGSVAVADSATARDVGGQWTAQAHAWLSDATHAPGRRPFPAVFVRGKPLAGDPFLVSIHEIGDDTATETGGDASRGR